jgi:polyisoprenoid-binding protein YceI
MSMQKKVAACLLAAAPLVASAAAESYTIDPYHTFPYFDVEHIGFSINRGRLEKVTGKLVIDTEAKTASVELTAPTATLTTGDNDRGDRPRARDEHLRSPDFFNVQEFPTITYQGAASKWNGDAPAEIDGKLTLLGVTKPVALTVIHWKCGPDPRTQGKRQMCGGNATGSFKRSDFGMKFAVPQVGDEVKLWIELEAFKN